MTSSSNRIRWSTFTAKVAANVYCRCGKKRLERCARAVVVIGEARPLITRALADVSYPVTEAESLEGAVEVARRNAQPGDAVLLAPACASFDMFRSYAHRGEVFQAAVQRLHGGS